MESEKLPQITPALILGTPERLRQIGKELKRWDVVEQIIDLEHEYENLSDEALAAKTHEFKSRIKSATSGITNEKALEKKEQEILNEILPEAFAAVREATKRTLGLSLHEEQLMCGIVLHQGASVEMITGEGKTLAATLPLYLNALLGKGVHLVTTNDYLARRDARDMSPIFRSLGMSVGVLQSAATTEQGKKAFIVNPYQWSQNEPSDQLECVDRKKAYDADITYGPNSEFGFDYLKDNRVLVLSNKVQRGHHFAIVDEDDHVLIDDAQNPLIISEKRQQELKLYAEMNTVVEELKPGDYQVLENDGIVHLTENGYARIEKILKDRLPDPKYPEQVTDQQAITSSFLQQALNAHFLYKKDVDYIVDNGKVIIVDKHNHRPMPGRRWHNGLHQAIEAKEKVNIEPESITKASITYQNYFRMYKKLSGMSGSALTAAEEFYKVYGLEVIAIPPHTENRRIDLPDVIYKTKEAKMRAIVTDIITRHIKGQPILVGTTSIEKSAEMSNYLNSDSIQTILKTILLRDAWFRKKGIIDDGRAIKELSFINRPLNKVGLSKLNNSFMKLGLSPSIIDSKNIRRLVEILNLDETKSQKLINIIDQGIPHTVLNAKYHDIESQIIASAGKFGAVTIATNMAGRGVDIKLGGDLPDNVTSTVNKILIRSGFEKVHEMTNEDKAVALSNIDFRRFKKDIKVIQIFRKHVQDQLVVRDTGGLHVIGSERHEARRIDNQLRGRAARQGDPGSSKFYISLDDDLYRRFNPSLSRKMMDRMGTDDSFPIKNKLINKFIEDMQLRAEGANFDVRKHLIEYDDVLNRQRDLIYLQRDRLLVKPNFSDDVEQMFDDEIERRVETNLSLNQNAPLETILWTESVQPTFQTKEGVYPSFGMSLILNQVDRKDIPGSVIKIITQAIELDTEPENATEEIKSPKIENDRKIVLAQIQADLAEILKNPDNKIESNSDILRLLITLSKDKPVIIGSKDITTKERATTIKIIPPKPRFTFSPLAAKLLENMDTETAKSKVAEHFENATKFGVRQFGINEYTNIMTTRRPPPKVIGDLGKFAVELFGEERGKQELGSLSTEERNKFFEYAGNRILDGAERQSLLLILNDLWEEQLTRLEETRTSVGLEAYGQKDPLVQYKLQSSELFRDLSLRARSIFIANILSRFGRVNMFNRP